MGTYGDVTPEHERVLKDRAVAPDVAKERGYRSIPGGLLSMYNLKDHGFVTTLVIPLYTPLGRNNMYMHRPDTPRVRNGKPVKYEYPNKPLQIDVHPRLVKSGDLFNPKIPLWVTESPIKADAAVSHGLCCVAINGVYGWRGKNEYGGVTTLPEWEEIPTKNRQLNIGFDSDSTRNRNVYDAQRRLKKWQEHRGAIVKVAYIPETTPGLKVGLDDFFAQGGTREQLEQLLTSKLRPPEYDAPIRQGGYDLTDEGNAHRLVSIYGNEIFYVAPWDRWVIWDETRWRKDDTLQIEEYAANVVQTIYRSAAKITDIDARKAAYGHATRSDNGNKHQVMITHARKMVTRTPNELNNDEMLFNTLNGTVDLRTGELYPHNPADMITRVAPVQYDPDAKSQDLQDFLDLSLQGDKEMIEYMQRLTGYLLTGSTKAGAFYYIKGRSRTGKTTWTQALLDLFGYGEYGWQTNFGTFVKFKHTDTRASLASFEGKRLIVASEVEHGQTFNEALIKDLTGNNKELTARMLYHEEYSAKHEAKLVFTANDFPHVRRDDDAMWNRLHLIPFDNEQFAHDKYLPLKDAITSPTNRSAILTWAVQGALKWDGQTIPKPLAVQIGVAKERDESDLLNDWLNQRADIGPYEVLFADLFRSYQSFHTSREKPLGRNNFGRALQSYGFQQFSRAGVWYRGLRLRMIDDDPEYVLRN